MKKCFFIVLTLFYSGMVYSQCTPSANTVPGVTPDLATNLPFAYAGVHYSTIVQVRTPLDTTVNGTYASLTSVQITGISNLPAGFSYSCNPANCTLGPLSNGCMLITGNPTLSQAGVYLLDINVKVSGKLYGIIPVTQNTKISDYKIKIYGPPVANFTLNAYNICEGESVQFSDNSSNKPTSYLWTFFGGNPASSTLENPIVVYNTPGPHNVKLKVTSPAGTNTITKTAILNVKSAPKADLVSYDNDTICNTDSSYIEAAQVSNSSYTWFKNGTLITGATNYFLYAKKEGNYQVNVNKLSNGCSALSQPKFVKRVLLNASISTVSGSSTCSPNQVTLIAHQNSNFNYRWYKGNNPISGANTQIYNAAVSGDYKVRVSNPRGCFRMSDPFRVDVYPKPAAEITATGPTTFCQGQNVILQANSLSTPATYSWNRNSTVIPGANNKKYTATQQGWYTVRVTNQYGCSRLSTRTRITVNCRISDDQITDTGLLAMVTPNPATSSAVIAFENEETSPVTIDLYDLLGKKMNTISKGVYEAGEHEIFLSTESYSRGAYFVRINSGSEQKTLKLILQ